MENSQDKSIDNLDQMNNDLLEILTELTNVISMEEKYRAIGINMKSREALLKLMERMNDLQK